MTISPAGLELCVYCECGDKGPDMIAYQDAVGVWTYGVGAIVKPDGSRVQEGDTITKSDALSLFLKQVDEEGGHFVRAWAGPLAANQAQFDALADFCYNRGAGRLRSLLAMSHSNQECADNMLKFDFAGDPPRTLLGLSRRRRMERAMYLGQEWQTYKNWEPA